MGAQAAAVWCADQLMAAHPECGAAAKVGEAYELGPACTLWVEGAAPATVAPFSAVVRRMLAEGAEREALAARLAAAEANYRQLSRRLSELRGELDTSQQRHAVFSERNRIAQDLHDRAAQTNFLMALKLDWLLERLPPDSPMRGDLAQLKELAGQAAAQTREAIYALRAPELQESGLPGGLKRLVRSMQEQGLEASFSASGVGVPLPPAIEDALFKVAQEAVNNARNHSRGTAVIVSLRFARSQVTLVVQDNGVGLARGTGAKPGRFGLSGMRERIAAIGGTLELISGDECGLIVRAVVPLGGGES